MWPCADVQGPMSMGYAAALAQLLSVGYNIVCRGLCECNEHDPLQTYFMVDWLFTS